MEKWLNKIDISCSDSNESETDADFNTQGKTKKIKLKRLKTKNKKETPKFSYNWLDVQDFKGWLKKSTISENAGHCKVCLREIICYNKNCLVRHSKSLKHLSNMDKITNKKNHPDIEKAIQDLPLNYQVKRAELILGAVVATKCLSFSLMDTLGPILPRIFPDSKIAKQLSLKRTKTSAVVNSLGTVLLEDLADKLKKPGSFFSIIMDETTDLNNIKQCAFTVIFYDEDLAKVQTSFFDLIETNSATAEDLYSLLIKVIEDKNIPLQNLIGFSSDTANNMAGEYLSVFALLKKNFKNIVTVKCSCHLIHLVASKACLKLSNSAEELLRNLAAYFHRSYKRIKGLEEFQEYFGVEIHKILSPSTTRWLSLRSCVNRVLEQYTPIHVYLQGELSDKPSPTLLSMIKTMDNRFTYITLQFLSYSLEMFTNFNILFQSERPLLHQVKPEVEKLIKNICSNYIDIAYIRKNDIFNQNHTDPKIFVPLREIYIGTAANESLVELIKKEPSLKIEVDEFKKNILSFYIEAVTIIKKKFVFEDKLFEFINIIEPKTARAYQLKSLDVILKRFPALLDFVSLQKLDNEWKEHALLNLDEYNISINLAAEIYWQKIFELTNAIGDLKFINLKIVINMLLVLPFSNVSVERIFSDLNNTKTDHRNCLSSKTLKSLLVTKNILSKDILNFEPSEKMINANIWDKPK